MKVRELWEVPEKHEGQAVSVEQSISIVLSSIDNQAWLEEILRGLPISEEQKKKVKEIWKDVHDVPIHPAVRKWEMK